MRKHTSTNAARKWARQREEQKRRLERIRKHRAEIARLHSRLGRLNPDGNQNEIRHLTQRIRTLEQMIRYMNAE